MEKSVIDLVLLHCKLSSATDSNPSTSLYPTATLFFPDPSLRLDFVIITTIIIIIIIIILIFIIIS